MGKKDTITKAYMSKPEYFADAFNFYMFEGEQVVKTDELCAVDSTELGIIFKNENDEIVQNSRCRDSAVIKGVCRYENSCR